MIQKIRNIRELKQDKLSTDKRDSIYKVLSTLENGTKRIQFFTLGILNHEYDYDPVTKLVLAERHFSTAKRSEIPELEFLYQYGHRSVLETVNAKGKRVVLKTYDMNHGVLTFIKETSAMTTKTRYNFKPYKYKYRFDIVSRINSLQWF